MSYIDVIGIICLILILCMVIVLLESKRECSKFRITQYRFDTEKLPAGKELRIAMIADLHNSRFGGDNESVIKAISTQKPDIIILAGDMLVSRAGKDEDNLKTAEFVKRLSEIAEVYYGVGNHEKGVIERIHNVGDIWQKYSEKLYEDGCDRIHYMDNKVMAIGDNDESVMLYGLDLERDYYKRVIAKKLDRCNLANMLGEVNPDSYNILIAHNPDYFEKYAEWGADLILSGHNHGGLVRLPVLGGVISPRLRILPKYDYGVFEKGSSKMVLTNGIGAHSLKIRVNNVPEIVYINIVGNDV